MKMIRNYNDYLFDVLFEQADKDMPVKISDRLLTLLKEIEHPISIYLSRLHTRYKLKPITLIDYDDDELNKFTVSQSNKVYDYMDQLLGGNREKRNKLFNSNYNDKEFWEKHRSSIKIGRVINKLFPDKFLANGDPGNDIESFVNAIKMARTNRFSDFKLVEGEDIKKYYNENTYDVGESSILHKSCMRNDNCADYMDFLIKNNVKMLILMGEKDKNKIRGRALVWKLSKLEGKDTDRIFMDRIYTINDYDINKYRGYADNDGWLYKGRQDRHSFTEVYNPLDKSLRERSMVIDDIESSTSYPYMDTFKYYNIEENYLTNNYKLDYNYELQSTQGGYKDKDEDIEYIYHDGYMYTSEDFVYSEIEDRYIFFDDAAHNESEEIWASYDYAERNWQYSETESTWFNESDTVYIDNLGDHVSIGYADNHYAYSQYDDQYLEREDCIESEWNGWIPKKYAIEVYDYVGRETKNIDWRDNRSEEYIKLKTIEGEIEYYDKQFQHRFYNNNKYEYDKENDIYKEKGT